MNPPFSSSPLIEGRHAAATFEHIRASLARLCAGGRTRRHHWREFCADLEQLAREFRAFAGTRAACFTASLARGFFARHGTSVESRLTVFDKTPAENPKEFRKGSVRLPTFPNCSRSCSGRFRRARFSLRSAGDGYAPILGGVGATVKPITPIAVSLRAAPPLTFAESSRPTPLSSTGVVAASAPRGCVRRSRSSNSPMSLRLESAGGRRAERGLYEPYAVQSIVIRARNRIRRRSSNPPPWRRSRRQNPPIGRICQRASSSPDCSPTPRSRASSTPAKPTAFISPVRSSSTRASTRFRRAGRR